MSRDYAKKSYKKPSRSSKRKSDQPRKLTIWVWLTAALSVGLFAMGLSYIKTHGNKDLPAVVQVVAPQENHSVENLAENPSKPRFEFYTMLPKDQVPEQNKAAVEQHDAAVGGNFFIQVASGKNGKDANKMKAELSMLGFDADVKTLQQSGETWYRVQVGPFHSKRVADIAQQRLAEHNITGLLRKFN